MNDDVTPAPVDPGQAPTPGDVTPGGGASWLDGFNDDLKGYVETKGFKDPSALADSYRNLEKLRGVPADQLVQLPADMSDMEAMAPVYDRMGRPEAPDKYTNTLGDTFDGNTFAQIADQAHKLGLSDVQFKGMQEVTQQLSVAMTQAEETAAAEAFDNWKASNEDGFNNAARMMAALGVNEDQLADILSGDKTGVYDFLAKASAKLGEAQPIHGDPPGDGGQNFNMSPDAAKLKISELLSDDAFMKQYTSTNQKMRGPAIARMEELHKIAAKAG